MNFSYDTIVIGGGSSGMMAAIVSARAGQKVLLVEKNKNLGEKLKISGGGRCNILNYELDTAKLLSNYGEANKFLFSPFSKFGVKESEEFFKNLGIEIKIEDRKRAFPKSEKAMDVFNVLNEELERLSVEILTETKVLNIDFELSDKVKKVSGIKTRTSGGEEKILKAQKYIVACGGYSHPETGSTGDGFKFLEVEDIKINTPVPSLVPVAVSNNWVKKLTGKTVENIKISFYVDGTKKKVLKLTDAKSKETKNRVLFTHFGLSGPTILNNSKYINELLSEGEVLVVFDLFPQLDEKQMDKFLLEIFEGNLNKSFKSVLKEIYPGNILEEILLENLPDLDLSKKINDIRVQERKAILNLLKNLKINITGLMGFDKAIIASGGVDVSEVNFENMSLKKISNLCVTGDMLDINRPSGGYSLQLCWTTGYIAGSGKL